MCSKIISLIKGTCYRSPKDIAAARLLDNGDQVILQRELDNPKDPFAIRVLTRPGNFIGYVDRVYSERLCECFEFLKANVCSIKHTTIPFISLVIEISDHRITQPVIETDPSKLSPSERMMILADIVESSTCIQKIPESYVQFGCAISWTEDLPRENILRAKQCRSGEPLKMLVHRRGRYPNRIEVLTTDNILIGYIDEDAYPRLAEYVEHISMPVISSLSTLDNLTCIFFLPHEICQGLQPSTAFFNYPYKEISEASNLAKENPLLALDVIQYAISKEKGITAKEVALTCYWYLKDWSSRREMAIKMLNVIDSTPEDELSGSSYVYYHQVMVPKLLKIIDTCNKKLCTKKKKL